MAEAEAEPGGESGEEVSRLISMPIKAKGAQQAKAQGLR